MPLAHSTLHPSLKAADFPVMAFQGISSSATLPPSPACREWGQTSPHNQKEIAKGRSTTFLPCSAPSEAPTWPAKPLPCSQASLLSRGGKHGCQVSPEAPPRRRGRRNCWEKWDQGSGHQPLAADMERLTSSSLSYLRACGHLSLLSGPAHELFPSLDQIRDHDLLIVINIA